MLLFIAYKSMVWEYRFKKIGLWKNMRK